MVRSLKEEATFPPVLVIEAYGERYPAGGYHRCMAYKQLGGAEIAARICDEEFYLDSLKRGHYFY
jgi:hypothetical protein